MIHSFHSHVCVCYKFQVKANHQLDINAFIAANMINTSISMYYVGETQREIRTRLLPSEGLVLVGGGNRK